MNAVIYARYSSDRQREESIEGQLRECYAFARKNDISVIGESDFAWHLCGPGTVCKNGRQTGLSTNDCRQRQGVIRCGTGVEVGPLLP